MKLSKGAKSSERIIVVSENFVIKIDPNKKYKVMEKEPFSVISGISIFNFQDSKVGKSQKKNFKRDHKILTLKPYS